LKNYVEDTSVQGRKAEIDSKVAKIRGIMKEKALDAVYISKQQNFAWITAGGCNIVSRFVDSGSCAILITMEGQYFICGNIETLRMKEEELLEDLGFEERSFYWYENKTRDIINGLIGQNGKLAADIPLPGASDANPFILNLQKVLCDNEIARYFHMGKVFAEVVESFMLTIRPGDTEKEIAGRLACKLWENDLEAVLILIATDERIYKYRHAVPTNKPLEKMINISCNPRYKGLITKISRTMYFGKLPEELKEQHRKTLDVENRMIAATKPGVDDVEIFRLAQKLYADHGYPDMWKNHHQGGPQSYTNGFYAVNESNHEVVRPRQVYGYNPTITGTKAEDGFLVTEDGPVFGTYPIYFPKEIQVIDGIEFVRAGILERLDC